MAARRCFAGIDAGGTTFKLGVAGEDGALLGKTRIPTTGPKETVQAAGAALQELARGEQAAIVALGIASFGPVDVDPLSPDYGTILRTPKPGWSGAPLRAMMADLLGVPVALDTDVNAALLAEQAHGAAKGSDRAAYVTIGAGVGVSVQINGEFAGRPLHPELGHIRVERHKNDTAFAGSCNVHGGCLEGLLSAPALIARFGALEALPEDDPCWMVAGWYLAQLCLVLSLGWRVERIVLGGGVMNSAALLHRARAQYSGFTNHYLTSEDDPDKLIVRAALGDDAGLAGAIALAQRQFGGRGTEQQSDPCP